MAHRPRPTGHLRRLRRRPGDPRTTTTPRRWRSVWPEYHEETKPLIEIFERKEFVATIDATGSIVEVQQAIRLRFGIPPYVGDA